MPRFTFTITRKERCEREFTVEADNVSDGEQKALEAAFDHEWRRSDNVAYGVEGGQRLDAVSAAEAAE